MSFEDPQSAARDFIREWEAIRERYDERRKACMEAPREYDWDIVSARYLTLYKSVLGQSIRTILDVPIQFVNQREAIFRLERLLGEKSRAIVAFGNANLLNIAYANQGIREALRRFLVLNDGIGTDIASRLLYGSKFPDNLNGTDFVPCFLSRLDHGVRIFLLGARPGVARRAASRLLEQAPQLQIVGAEHGFGDVDAHRLIRHIQASRADILLVALGNPAQELWLARHFNATGCTLGIAVGGLFDFLAGEVSRAPRWVRAIRMEWIYRLCLEPHRLARRYPHGNLSFLSSVMVLWWSGARGGARMPLAQT